MNIKSIIKYFLIIALIAFASYLTFSLVTNNIKQKEDEQVFCSAKCNYSQGSYLWEFSGEYSTKGFTTHEECLSYCSKSWEGFAYRIVSESYASIMSLPFLSDIFKTK